MSRVVKSGLGYSDYVNFEKGEYNIVHISSPSWGSGTATLVYSPDGVLPGAPLKFNDGTNNTVTASGNMAVEMRSSDGKVGLLVATDPSLVVTLDIKGENNFYN